MSNDDPDASLEVPAAASDVATPDAAAGGTDDVADAPGIHDSRPRIRTRPTVRLDSKDLKPSWPIAIATLEQLADWSVLALRMGTLAMIQACVRDLEQPESRADLIVRLRDLVEALAHMPYEA